MSEPLPDVALLVIGNGRLDYLHQTVDAALAHLPEFGAYLMVDDSGDSAVRRELERHYPDFHLSSHDTNWGMARAVQDGFRMVLDETDCEYVFWLEEDMKLIGAPPVEEAIRILTTQPYLAQMMFRRTPWWGSEPESRLGDVLAAICEHDPAHHRAAHWTEHRHIFSLNPCLIPRAILERGWPADNEAGMTSELVEDGWWFGVWGHPNDGQVFAEHIGVGRGKKWQL